MSAPTSPIADDRQWWVRRVRVALAGYSVVVAFFLLNPSPGAAISVVYRASAWALGRGITIELAHPARIEFLLNALVFAPLVFLAAWLWPQHSWHRWTAWGFVLSFGVELFQGLFLTNRSAEHGDVVANTLGALLGSVALTLLMRSAWARHLPPALRLPAGAPDRSS